MKQWCLLILVISFSNVYSQVREETPAPNYISTIIFRGSSDLTGNPIVQPGESLLLEFDDLIGDEADYYYTIEHFNYDWSPSALVKSEYILGFDNVRIPQYENSFNTLQPYTHYQLRIPNGDLEGLKVSGNYLISVFNSERELVFSRKFMVYEPVSQVLVTVKRSRDLEYVQEKQVVNFSVNSPDLLLRNPDQTVKVRIIQNNNFKTAIENIEPQYTIGTELIYKYDQQTSFWAGNEFLAFDSKDIRSPTVSISSIELLDLYHHYLFLDRSRDTEPYNYNPDINGQFVIRTMQGENPDIESEYVWTHFSLMNYEPLNFGELHLYGAFNNFELDESTLMTYNEETGFFENARLFKQGFYNYKYVLLRPDGTLDEGFISGNFDETENQYTVLVYFRDLGARYDRIIGVGTANSVDITN